MLVARYETLSVRFVGLSLYCRSLWAGLTNLALVSFGSTAQAPPVPLVLLPTERDWWFVSVVIVDGVLACVTPTAPVTTILHAVWVVTKM
jgi:hypothetical protein